MPDEKPTTTVETHAVPLKSSGSELSAEHNSNELDVRRTSPLTKGHGHPTVHNNASGYGEDFKLHLLEQYKMFVEMADRVSSRRQAANTFYLSVNSALVVLYSLVGREDTATNVIEAWQYAVPMVGFAASLMWGVLIRSYRTLNSGKYKVIHDMESHLPARPYDAEWQYLKEGKTLLHIPLTHIEIWLPIFFGILYLFLAIRHFI